jgi:hypothetical protein
MKITKTQLREIIKEEILLRETSYPLAKKWKTLNTGETLKVGNIELIRKDSKRGDVHLIKKNGKVIGNFHLDRDATEDWWVMLSGGKDFYAAEIDDIVKKLK